jgi:hypothetical protein
MFTVNWVVRGKETEPIESERFRIHHVSTLIMACRYRMEMMRLKYPEIRQTDLSSLTMPVRKLDAGLVRPRCPSWFHVSRAALFKLARYRISPPFRS